jgi:hypothetical protein
MSSTTVNTTETATAGTATADTATAETAATEFVAPTGDVRTSTDSTGNSFAITSFVLGIASIVAGWTFIAPIVGLIFGVLALRRKTTERTLALWGVWLNVAMLALTVLAVLAMLAIFGIALAVGLPIFELNSF